MLRSKLAPFRRSLLRWYCHHGRDLPWRRTHDPYAILVSESMLQQTQVVTALPYYDAWLRRFPDFASLSRASENDVLHAWQGLGYYARARNLHLAAKIVQGRHGGQFPRELNAIRALPGVGRYTAHAVATFSFDQSVPIVEANTARVLARLSDLQTSIDSAPGREKLWRQAAQLVPTHGAARFNSALVDLGALVCLPRKPRCPVCPVRKFCHSRDPERLPVKKSRPGIKRLTEDHFLVVRQNKILLQKADRRWRNMWILPRLKLNGLKALNSRRPIHTSVFPFTHHRVALRVFHKKEPGTNGQQRRWFSIRNLGSIPIPSPHRRAIEELLAGA
ncbi:MAG TPA: A/G-specific adenine glycosylase [Chthoniobacterales bacterium]|nr:A/G-specific adenine glycosylase [Chthoniobacterales bacterium]